MGEKWGDSNRERARWMQTGKSSGGQMGTWTGTDEQEEKSRCLQNWRKSPSERAETKPTKTPGEWNTDSVPNLITKCPFSKWLFGLQLGVLLGGPATCHAPEQSRCEAPGAEGSLCGLCAQKNEQVPTASPTPTGQPGSTQGPTPDPIKKPRKVLGQTRNFSQISISKCSQADNVSLSSSSLM